MVWTDHRVKKLKELWNEGKPASKIADELGDVTSNAVIGKANRLGLTARESPIKRKVEVLPLKPVRECEWPIGHPGEPGFTFCNQPAEVGKPYCNGHCAMAYQQKAETDDSTTDVGEAVEAV